MKSTILTLALLSQLFGSMAVYADFNDTVQFSGDEPRTEEEISRDNEREEQRRLADKKASDKKQKELEEECMRGYLNRKANYFDSSILKKERADKLSDKSKSEMNWAIFDGIVGVGVTGLSGYDLIKNGGDRVENPTAMNNLKLGLDFVGLYIGISSLIKTASHASESSKLNKRAQDVRKDRAEDLKDNLVQYRSGITNACLNIYNDRGLMKNFKSLEEQNISCQVLDIGFNKKYWCHEVKEVMEKNSDCNGECGVDVSKIQFN